LEIDDSIVFEIKLTTLIPTKMSLINPETNRRIKRGGPTHKRLCDQGIMSEGCEVFAEAAAPPSRPASSRRGSARASSRRGSARASSKRPQSPTPEASAPSYAFLNKDLMSELANKWNRERRLDPPIAGTWSAEDGTAPPDSSDTPCSLAQHRGDACKAMKHCEWSGAGFGFGWCTLNMKNITWTYKRIAKRKINFEPALPVRALVMAVAKDDELLRTQALALIDKYQKGFIGYNDMLACFYIAAPLLWSDSYMDKNRDAIVDFWTHYAVMQVPIQLKLDIADEMHTPVKAKSAGRGWSLSRAIMLALPLAAALAGGAYAGGLGGAGKPPVMLQVEPVPTIRFENITPVGNDLRPWAIPQPSNVTTYMPTPPPPPPPPPPGRRRRTRANPPPPPPPIIVPPQSQQSQFSNFKELRKSFPITAGAYDFVQGVDDSIGFFDFF
jgi:hypothetical protein